MSIPLAEVVLGKGDPPEGLTQNGGGLPTLTNPGLHTKNTKRLTCVDAYQTLPESVLTVRNPLADLVWSPPPLPTLTTFRIWLGHHYNTLLPGLTIRPVKYTHMHPLDRPFIRNHNWCDHLEAWMRKGLRWLIVVNIVLAIFTVFNIYIYPEHIYEAPEPIRVSEPVDQLLPYEV